MARAAQASHVNHELCVFVVGMNTPSDATEDELVEFNRHYDDLHVPEILENNPQFMRGTRYRLAGPDVRNDLGPSWLTLYEIDGEDAARSFFAATSGAGESTQHYTAGPPVWSRKTITWRVLWRALGHERFDAPAQRVVTIGADAPPRASGNCVRFERVHVIDFPGAGCPPYCAFYEETSAPPAIAQDTVWRFVYEQIEGSSRTQARSEHRARGHAR